MGTLQDNSTVNDFNYSICVHFMQCVLGHLKSQQLNWHLKDFLWILSSLLAVHCSLCRKGSHYTSSYNGTYTIPRPYLGSGSDLEMVDLSENGSGFYLHARLDREIKVCAWAYSTGFLAFLLSGMHIMHFCYLYKTFNIYGQLYTFACHYSNTEPNTHTHRHAFEFSKYMQCLHV